MASTPIPYQDWLRYFEVTQIKSASTPDLSLSPHQDTIYRMYITRTDLSFGRVGDIFFAQELEPLYDHVKATEPAFLEIDPQNYRLPLAGLQRILLDRRPHLHNPLNGGSLHIWVRQDPQPQEYIFLLNYTTDADHLLDELNEACRAASVPLPEVREDPALHIAAAPLHIQLQWQRGMGLVLLVFSVCWVALITYLTAILFAMYPAQPSFANGAIIASLLLFLLVGLFLFYYSLTHILNYTHLSLAGGSLNIRAGPLPWAGSKRQVTVAPQSEIFINTRRLGQWEELPIFTTYVYDLVAAAPGSPPQRLISLSRLPHAVRVQKALQDSLNK